MNGKKTWFPAKRYGWGWGLPSCWQGWVVTVTFIALVTIHFSLTSPETDPIQFIVYLVILFSAFFIILWAKGETPRWRWGESDTGDHNANPLVTSISTSTEYGSKPASTSGKSNARALLVTHLCFGPLMLAMSIYFSTHLPPKMNSTYGYRTFASFKSQEAWDEAQRFSTSCMIIAATVTFVYQIISIFTMKPLVSVLTSVGVLSLTLLLVIPITENHLKKNFYEHGKRITLMKER